MIVATINDIKGQAIYVFVTLKTRHAVTPGTSQEIV
ncbi:MAG: hypothetical protein DVB23_003445 [Verrucomicrobia bacterium]|jgi:acyl-coenzyme A synthetase/AMP-(fatty) acid ligase|nr:MAG: hypothetical protein DVB23_003445 [Verrucomicrobiota bacterium]